MKNATKLKKVIAKLNEIKEQHSKEPSLEFKKSLEGSIETYEILVNYYKRFSKISLNKAMKYRLHRLMCFRHSILGGSTDYKEYDQMSARWEKFVYALCKLNPTFTEDQVREFIQEKYTEFKEGM